MISCKNIQLDDDIDWDGLVKESITATFFQTREWLSLWRKHFNGEGLIIGVFDGDNLVGIAPFIKFSNKLDFLGVTPVLGNELVADYGDIIAVQGKETEVWEAILKYLAGQELELTFLQEDSSSFAILKEISTKFEVIDVAPYINLPKTWEEYLLKLDRHNRHELRRKIRKLESEGAFKMCFNGNIKDADEFLRLMKISNEQKRNFLSKEMEDFFRDIISVFYPKKLVNLCFMEYEGENTAAIMYFDFHDRIYLYNSGFDQQYRHLSAGLVLKAFLIKESIEKGKKVFDFLRGGERYKYDLGGIKRNLYKISF